MSIDVQLAKEICIRFFSACPLDPEMMDAVAEFDNNETDKMLKHFRYLKDVFTNAVRDLEKENGNKSG